MNCTRCDGTDQVCHDPPRVIPLNAGQVAMWPWEKGTDGSSFNYGAPRWTAKGALRGRDGDENVFLTVSPVVQWNDGVDRIGFDWFVSSGLGSARCPHGTAPDLESAKAAAIAAVAELARAAYEAERMGR